MKIIELKNSIKDKLSYIGFMSLVLTITFFANKEVAYFLLKTVEVLYKWWWL